MAQLSPHLIFNGNCEDAFNYYKSVFGGEFGYVGRFKEMPPEFDIPDDLKEKIMHISLPVGQTMLMGNDANDMYGLATPIGNNFAITIYAESEEEATRIFEELSAAGTVKMPLEKSFWGALFGMFTDKFGVHWMITYEFDRKL